MAHDVRFSTVTAAALGVAARRPTVTTHSHCVLQITTRNQLCRLDCRRMNESTRPLVGLEAEGTMRLASFENLLAVATLVSAIVVVLWGIRLFHGA